MIFANQDNLFLRKKHRIILFILYNFYKEQLYLGDVFIWEN